MGFGVVCWVIVDKLVFYKLNNLFFYFLIFLLFTVRR